MKKNAYLSTSDPIIVVLYDQAESTELFGEEHIEEDGVHVPEELIARYKENIAAFKAIQAELRKLKAAQDK